MTFTGNIDLGSLVVAGSVIVGFLSSYQAMKGRLQVLESLVRDLTEDLYDLQRKFAHHQQNLSDLNAQVFPHARGRRGREGGE